MHALATDKDVSQAFNLAMEKPQHYGDFVKSHDGHVRKAAPSGSQKLTSGATVEGRLAGELEPRRALDGCRQRPEPQ